MITSGRRFFLIALFVAAIDQIVKLLVLIYLDMELIIVPGFFSLYLTRNTGASFSMFQDMNLILTFISLGVIGWIVWNHKKVEKKDLLGFSLILGGAIGNVADRIIRGAVIDYLNFYFWPIFNIADTAITIGAVLIMINYFRKI